MTTAIDQQAIEAADLARLAEGHSPRVAHHFDTMTQQYEAAKLGMWLFLATEVLLFGGLFCVYAVYRFNHPEVFTWGSQFLDVKLGAINTVVLISSSVTMAIAVNCTQMNRRWTVITALGITFLCGVVFMAIKSVEYAEKFREHHVWGVGFYEVSHDDEEVGGASETALRAGDLARGTKFWRATCRSCHGLAGEGITGQGKDIRASEFIQSRDDGELMAFIKVGRPVSDPLNTTGILMAPKGGNPLLTDADLIDIIAYIRSFQVPLAPEGDESRADEVIVPVEVEGDDGATGDVVVVSDVPAADAFWIPKSSIPDARPGPSGLDPAFLNGAGDHSDATEAKGERPTNAHLFFGIYFLMTGLHAIHVLGGLGMIAWLLLRTIRFHFGSTYFTPVDLGGLYWHIVDLIWIFLFPLFYLIA